MKFTRFTFTFFLILDGCIDPFNIQLNGNQQILMVEGMITDQPGPYTVKLFKTLALDDQLDKTNWVQGARVVIFDDQGTEETLSEVSPGNYQTTSIKGAVGKSYYIHITTAEGQQYQSNPEKLVAVGNITSLQYQFEQREFGNDINFSNTSNGFNILVDADILPEQNGLVRWRWTGTFEIRTYPELRTLAIATRMGIVIIPDPAPCSGYVGSRSGITQLSRCTCCYCWVTQFNNAPLLSDKKFINNNRVSQFRVDFIQANRRYLFDKYYIEVQQMSVSQAVYDFWKKVVAQEGQGSDLFQTPPPATTGNIQAVSPGAMPVAGIFAASAIKTQSLFIDQSAVPYFLPPIDTIATSCRLPYRYSTTIKPPFW